MSALALQDLLPGPAALAALKRRVQSQTPKAPGIYQFLDAAGGIIYVGKAKDLRTRLLSYFSAPWPESKSARLIRCAADIAVRPLPSEFAALLEEQRLIQRLRPAYNVAGNRYRASLAFVRLTGGAAPKLTVTETLKDTGAVYFGPFRGRGQALESVRTLADLLGLRDCADHIPLTFADQPSLFDTVLQPACIRHDLGNCLGPCAARVGAERYAEAARAAVAFLDGRSAHPLDRALDAMADASDAQAYERAALWRRRFDDLTWLFAAVARLRAAVEALNFVYEVKDQAGGGDDRVYLVRHGTIRTEAALPRSPLERQAFAAGIRRHVDEAAAAPAARGGPDMAQLLLVMSWFRQHPEEYDRTSPFSHWARETA